MAPAHAWLPPFPLLLLLLQPRMTRTYAEYMVEEGSGWCETPFRVGEQIMGAASVPMAPEREVLMYRGETRLHPGDPYISEESVNISLSNRGAYGGEFVWETDGGTWVGGSSLVGCKGRRSLPDAATRWATLRMPSHQDDGYHVTLLTAFAKRYGAVEMSNPVTLQGPKGPRPRATPPSPVPARIPAPLKAEL